MLPKTKVSKDLGLATDLTNTSGRSASRAMPKARLTYCLQLDCTVFGFDKNDPISRPGAVRTRMQTLKIGPDRSINVMGPQKIYKKVKVTPKMNGGQ